MSSDKKLKKDKKRKAEEAVEESTPTVEVADSADEKARKKAEKKAAKKAKREAEEEPAETTETSTASALGELADELVLTKSADADEEPVDLIALKKNKKMAVHASRAAGGASEAPAAFQPDEGAVVIAEPVRIFLGNLPFKITDELIHEAFDEFGEIQGIHWVTDKSTGQFYGTAFVDYGNAAAAKAALVRNGIEILGRAIKVNMATGANVAGKNRFNTKEKKGGHLAKLPISEKPDGCNTVFLGNLSFSIDEAALRDVFGNCGEISDIRWVEKDGEFKGCGFIEFTESWSTDEAVKLNGADVLGRPMRVDYSARGSR